MSDPAVEDLPQEQASASPALWARLRALAGGDGEQGVRSRTTYQLMYEFLEATAAGSVDDSPAIAEGILRQIGAAEGPPLLPEARARILNATLARVTSPDLAIAKPRIQVEVLEEVIARMADGSADTNSPLARLAVGALGPYFQSLRRSGDRQGGRHGNKRRSLHLNDSRAEDLFGDAIKLSETIPIDEAAYRYLRRHSRVGDMDEAEWTAKARLSVATGRLLDKLDYDQLITLIGENNVARAFNKVAPGTLFLMFHTGFIRAAKRLFTGFVPSSGKESLLLAPGGTHQAAEDPRQALFGALRSLQDGHNLWVAPDGSLGKQSVTFNVLGTTSTGGEGAALLAYTSRCPTAYYRLVLRQDLLTIVVEPGPPRCEKGESFRDFGQRFHRAYAEKLSELLTADPLNLVVRPRWSRVFAAAEEDDASES